MAMPVSSVASLAVTTQLMSDDVLSLIRLVGQISTRYGDPAIMDMMTPNIQMISLHLDVFRCELEAVLAEQGGYKRGLEDLDG